MRLRNGLIQALAMFGSLSTLLCCALPALLVSLGAGAALASIVSAVPQLIWLSEHKVALFIIAGAMLFLAIFSAYRNRNAPCPTEPALARSCLRMRRLSVCVLAISAVIYLVGFSFAFLPLVRS